MSKLIHIYWHIYLFGNWTEVVEEQSDLLSSSLLFQNCSKLTIGIIGDEQLTEQAKKIIVGKLGDGYLGKIIFLYSKENVGEYLTLQKLYKDCMGCQCENYILYFHTKGVTRYKENKPDLNLFYFYWRNIMQFFLIEKWGDCVNIMNSDPTIDVCGVFFRDKNFTSFSKEEISIYENFIPILNKKHTISHYRKGTLDLRFCGNFWWTKTSHVQRISDHFTSSRLKPLTSIRFSKRVWHEQFILSKKAPYFVFSFCDIDYFCNPGKYVNKPEGIKKQLTEFFDLIIKKR